MPSSNINENDLLDTIAKTEPKIDSYFYDIAMISQKRLADIVRFAHIYCNFPISIKKTILDLERKKTLTLIKIIERSFNREIRKTIFDWEELTRGNIYEGIYPKLCSRFLTINECML